MSAIKRYVEDLVYSLSKDEFYKRMKELEWEDSFIENIYDSYRGKIEEET